MQFDVYFIGEFLAEELSNIWTGEGFGHPSQFSPFYYNKRELANAYKLLGGLQAERLKETGGELRLVKQSFVYQDSIAQLAVAANDTLAAA